MLTPVQPLTLTEKINNLFNVYKPRIPIGTIKAIESCEGGETYPDHPNYKNGVKWSEDVGPFQINDFYHEADAKAQGFDIYTVEGNIGYALTLMKNGNLSFWSASRACWSS